MNVRLCNNTNLFINSFSESTELKLQSWISRSLENSTISINVKKLKHCNNFVNNSNSNSIFFDKTNCESESKN